MAPRRAPQDRELSAAPGAAAAPARGAGGAGVPSPGVSAAEPARRRQCLRGCRLHPLPHSSFLGHVGVKGALLPCRPFSLSPCLRAGWAVPVPLCVCTRVGAAVGGAGAATPQPPASWGLLGGCWGRGSGAARRSGLTEEILGRVLLVIRVLGEVVDFLAHSSEGS